MVKYHQRPSTAVKIEQKFDFWGSAKDPTGELI